MKTKYLPIAFSLVLIIFTSGATMALNNSGSFLDYVDMFDNGSNGRDDCPDKPFVKLMPDDAQVVGQDTILVCVYDTVNLDPGPGFRYTWSDNSTDQYYRISTSGIGYDVQTHYVIAEDPELGCTDTVYLTVVFSYTACVTGVSERYEDTFGEIYPNPGNGIFNIPIKDDPGQFTMEVIDMNGQLKYQEKYQNNFQGSLLTLDLQTLPDGFYMVRILGTDFSYNKKLVIR